MIDTSVILTDQGSRNLMRSHIYQDVYNVQTPPIHVKWAAIGNDNNLQGSIGINPTLQLLTGLQQDTFKQVDNTWISSNNNPVWEIQYLPGISFSGNLICLYGAFIKNYNGTSYEYYEDKFIFLIVNTNINKSIEQTKTIKIELT